MNRREFRIVSVLAWTALLLIGATGSAAVPQTNEASQGIEAVGSGLRLTAKGPPVWLDPFDSEALDPAWFWINENPETWSLSERTGYMRIYAAELPLGGENLLLRPGAEGNFAIETVVEFEPTSNFQAAGLVIYQDPANTLALVRAFCDTPDACVGNGVYFDYVRDGAWVNGNFGTSLTSAGEVFLRLELKGWRITAFYSEDGESWTEIGRHEVSSSFRANAVGLVSAQNYSGPAIAADFDYFSFSGHPQPASPFVGHWQAIDGDGSEMGLSFGGPPGGPFNVNLTDSYIGWCNGEPGIIKGTGWISPDNRYILEAEMVLECLTTGATLDLSGSWRYDPIADRLLSGSEGEVVTTWHRPGKPLPWAWRLIIAHPDEDWAEGWGFEEATVVSLAIFDQAGALLYYDTAVAAFPEWNPDEAYVEFFLGYDLRAGEQLWMTDGSYAKDLIVSNLQITDVDLLANSISGTAEPGSQIIIEFPPDVMFEVTADPDGLWSATVDGLSLVEYVLVSQEDGDGDLTRASYVPPNPFLIAFPIVDEVFGYGWPEGSEVQLSIPGTAGLLTVTVGSAPWDPDDILAYFPLAPYDLKTDDPITLSGSGIERTHTVRYLTYDSVDIVADTVAGMSGPGAEVHSWVHGIEGSDVYSPSEEAGFWEAHFGFDLSEDMCGRSEIRDNGNSTAVDWCTPPAMELRVNYGHDWVESFYEAGHTVWLTVTEADGLTPKATATATTEPKEFWGGESGFTTLDTGWEDDPPNLEPGDWVFATVDNGVTAEVQLGDIQGSVDVYADSIQGTVEALWIDEAIFVECLDWGQDPPAESKYGGTVSANGSDPYGCSWDPTEWDIQPWQDIGVGYFTPDGHWVANAFHAEQWHRINPDQDNPTPEHEVLSCEMNASWICDYSKQAEPALGFEDPPDSTYGEFVGTQITDGWTCPDWFAPEVCGNLVAAADGVMSFHLSDGTDFAVEEQLIVAEKIDGQRILYAYWINQGFYCPWYRTFDEALAANPFTAPFNGVDWPAMDCTFE